MAILRWFGATVAISGATILYSVLLALAVSVLFPNAVRNYHSLFLDEPVTGAAVRSGIDWGMLAAMFMGPMVGFTLVRDFNAAIERPGPVQGWWRFVVRDTAKSFLLIALSGFGFCGLIAAVIAIQGGTREDIYSRAYFALVLAHAGGALVVALGHFVRNPPDLRLGSYHDLKSNEPDPPDRL